MGNLSSLNIDFEQISTRNSFDLIPDGTYNAIVENADIRDTKNGTGKYVSIQWCIVDGEYQGRKLFQNCNIVNSNPKAEEIGRQELKSIIAAMGKTNVGDTDELLNNEVQITVEKRKRYPKDPDNSEMQNAIKAVAPKATKQTGAKSVMTAGTAPWAK